jgi:hypothetical protein
MASFDARASATTKATRPPDIRTDRGFAAEPEVKVQGGRSITRAFPCQVDAIRDNPGVLHASAACDGVATAPAQTPVYGLKS